MPSGTAECAASFFQPCYIWQAWQTYGVLQKSVRIWEFGEERATYNKNWQASPLTPLHPQWKKKKNYLRLFDLPSWEMDCLTEPKISDLMAKWFSDAMEVVRDYKYLLVKFYLNNGRIQRIDLRFIGDVPSISVGNLLFLSEKLVMGIV